MILRCSILFLELSDVKLLGWISKEWGLQFKPTITPTPEFTWVKKAPTEPEIKKTKAAAKA